MDSQAQQNKVLDPDYTLERGAENVTWEWKCSEWNIRYSISTTAD
jgi:hypothetical protein